MSSRKSFHFQKQTPEESAEMLKRLAIGGSFKKDEEEPNKFDLKKRPDVGVFVPGIEKQFTPEEIEDMKVGHFEVPRSKWPDLSYGNKFNYQGKDGKFYIGGFIKKNINEKISIGPMPSAGMRWDNNVSAVILYDDIEKLFKRYAPTAAIEIEMLVNSIKEMSRYLKEYNRRIGELESEVARLKSEK